MLGGLQILNVQIILKKINNNNTMMSEVYSNVCLLSYYPTKDLSSKWMHLNSLPKVENIDANSDINGSFWLAFDL